MIDLEDEWIGSNPSCPECGNACSMLDACVMSVAEPQTKVCEVFTITEKYSPDVLIVS